MIDEKLDIGAVGLLDSLSNIAVSKLYFGNIATLVLVLALSLTLIHNDCFPNIQYYLSRNAES